MSISALISKTINTIPSGEPFTTARFLAMGTRPSIDQTLSRLAKAGAISRLARGVYVRPQKNRYIGQTAPEPFKIAEAIGAATGATVQVHGAEAARRLGLTTQVPSKPVYVTNGPSRRFRVGNLLVELRHVSPRKLRFSGTPAGLALSALWHLGRGAVTSETISAIRSRLSPAEFEALRSAAYAMPGWMSDAFRRFEAEQKDA